jgi:hypothetical protein
MMKATILLGVGVMLLLVSAPNSHDDQRKQRHLH